MQWLLYFSDHLFDTNPHSWFLLLGLLFSCITLAVVAFICCVAFLLLVKVRLIVRENFQDMGFVLYGKWMRLLVLWAVALSQMGFVCAYLIFVSQNLFAVVQTFTKCQFTGIQEKFYILIPLVVLIPLVLIRRMAILSLPSMLANVFIIIGIVYLWYFSIDSLAQHGMGPEIKMFNSESFALFLGTAVFSYEGIGLSKCPFLSFICEQQVVDHARAWLRIIH